MKNTQAAKRYAKAFTDRAVQTGDIERVIQDVLFLKRFFSEESDLKRIFFSPLASVENKKMILQSQLGQQLYSQTLDLINLVLEKRREDSFLEILEQTLVLYDQSRSVKQAQVVSAVGLSDKQREDIKKKVLAFTGAKQVELSEKVDPSILAGIVLSVGDKLYDASLATRLKNIKKTVTQSKK